MVRHSEAKVMGMVEVEGKLEKLVSDIEDLIAVPHMPLQVRQYLGAAETEIEMARDAYEYATGGGA